jgi:hypothetical protein
VAAGDRLLLGPGEPPKLRRGSAWRALHAAALDDGSYRELKAALLDAAEVSGGGSNTNVEFRAARLDGRLRVSACVTGAGRDERMWIRRTHLASPELQSFGGALEPLLPYLDAPHALILAAAPGTAAADELLQALMAARLARTGGTALVAEEDPVYAAPAGAAVVLSANAAALGAMLRTAAPDLVALPCEHALGASALLGCLRVPGLAAAVVAAPGAAALERWIATLPAEVSAAVRALLAHTPAAVVHAGGEAGLVVRTGARVWGDGALASEGRRAA